MAVIGQMVKSSNDQIANVQIITHLRREDHAIAVEPNDLSSF
jgi:hypothetical protein